MTSFPVNERQFILGISEYEKVTLVTFEGWESAKVTQSDIGGGVKTEILAVTSFVNGF